MRRCFKELCGFKIFLLPLLQENTSWRVAALLVLSQNEKEGTQSYAHAVRAASKLPVLEAPETLGSFVTKVDLSKM